MALAANSEKIQSQIFFEIIGPEEVFGNGQGFWLGECNVIVKNNNRDKPMDASAGGDKKKKKTSVNYSALGRGPRFQHAKYGQPSWADLLAG